MSTLDDTSTTAGVGGDNALQSCAETDGRYSPSTGNSQHTADLSPPLEESMANIALSTAAEPTDDNALPGAKDGNDEEAHEHEQEQEHEHEHEHEALRGSKCAPDACLFVASLNAQRTDEQLTESVTHHFLRWGNIMNVKVMKDWMNRPYAFVQYEHVENAKHALKEGHDTVIDGRHIRVEQARVNRTLFLAKFPKSMTEETLCRYLEKWGEIEDITILQNYATGRSKGCGFAKFKYREEAIRAYLQIRQQGRWAVEWAANLDKSLIEMDRHAIFIGQLDPDTLTEADVEQRFGAYGPMDTVNFVNKAVNIAAGEVKTAFAFVRYRNEDSAARAIEHENGATFGGRKIRVQYRETPESRAQKKAMMGQAPFQHQGLVMGNAGIGLTSPNGNPVLAPYISGVVPPPSLFNVFGSPTKPRMMDGSTPMATLQQMTPMYGVPIMNYAPVSAPAAGQDPTSSNALSMSPEAVRSMQPPPPPPPLPSMSQMSAMKPNGNVMSTSYGPLYQFPQPWMYQAQEMSTPDRRPIGPNNSMVPPLTPTSPVRPAFAMSTAQPAMMVQSPPISRGNGRARGRTGTGSGVVAPFPPPPPPLQQQQQQQMSYPTLVYYPAQYYMSPNQQQQQSGGMQTPAPSPVFIGSAGNTDQLAQGGNGTGLHQQVEPGQPYAMHHPSMQLLSGNGNNHGMAYSTGNGLGSGNDEPTLFGQRASQFHGGKFIGAIKTSPPSDATSTWGHWELEE
ncbi:hypothetical protein RI367_008158 [Sorochytrium milnesiophthora]